MKILQRIGWYFGRRRHEAELAEEIELHRTLAQAEAEAAGQTPREAEHTARRRFGNDAALREQSRQVWTFGWVEALGRDIRLAARTLRRRPGFAFAVSASLALGIGATTAFWSILHPVLLRPLPYDRPEQLVALREVKGSVPEGQSIISGANAMFWRERSRTLADVGIYSWASITLADEPAEDIRGRAISTNLLRILRARPILGRSFQAEDTLSHAPVAMLLSYRLWMRRFHGDSSIIGKSVRAREADAVIIGVMPPGFRSFGDEEYWEPLPITSQVRTPRGRSVFAIGRMAAGQTIAAANAELKTIARGLEAEYPQFDTGWSVRVLSLTDEVIGNARRVLWLLGGAIGFVLLVACANVANLHLGQAIARRNELSLRAALGASRAQVIRHWLVQGLMLALVGGALGVTLAVLVVRLIVSLRIGQVPRLSEVRVDLPVFGFAALVTILAGLGFGLAPALTVREGRLRGITTGYGGMDLNPRATRLRSGLVVLQVALCFVLLVGAGLAVRSLRLVLREDPGLDPEGVVNFQVSLPQRDYRNPAARDAFFQVFVRGIRELPGVEQVGVSSFLPFRTIQPATAFVIVGEPDPGPGNQPVTQVNEADEGYFPALGIPLLSGRLLASDDRRPVPAVVLVNRALSRMLGGERAALGRQLKVFWRQPDSLLTVVGVVGDVRVDGLDAPSRPMVYFPIPVGGSSLNVSVRAAGNPLMLGPSLHRLLAAQDPGLPLLDLQSMNDRLAASVAGRRYPMALLSGLGIIALLLAAIGLYGVLSYAVTQRQRELGLRRAIGASEGSVVRLVLNGGFRLTVIGIAIGLVAALGATRYLSGLLYQISPRDIRTFIVTGLVVGGVALMASLVPARRASRVDPIIALRGEGR